MRELQAPAKLGFEGGKNETTYNSIGTMDKLREMLVAYLNSLRNYNDITTGQLRNWKNAFARRQFQGGTCLRSTLLSLSLLAFAQAAVLQAVGAYGKCNG